MKSRGKVDLLGSAGDTRAAGGRVGRSCMALFSGFAVWHLVARCVLACAILRLFGARIGLGGSHQTRDSC